ncbi:Ferric/cupric reductase transmembrane component 1 [Lachnellula cervina]|uniref:Ferric/cupric reductase transmembrane component 1 n=1 Tax=Lachnellula cervina TaxID=1316786 RepID=A0A7D8UKP0_9HELO|nr:Ferric/cupric reductase transmembrane component 1 [Lachnellula cervina]
MKLPLLLPLCFLTASSLAHVKDFHFPDYGFHWYNPVCGNACYDALSSAPLSCSSGPSTSVAYQANDTAFLAAFLATLAYCMNSTCDADKVPVWKREKFWAATFMPMDEGMTMGDMAMGDMSSLPKWDYAEALFEVTEAPTVEFNSSSKSILNQTVLVSKADYEMQSKFMVLFDYLESLQPKYSFVLLAIGFGTPIFFTLLAHLPFMPGVLDKIKPYLVYPSIFGTYSVRPRPWLLGNVPTIGQALYIALFCILNLVLCSVNYSHSQPHPWGFTPKEETLAYIGYRTGHIAYALLPLLILFCSRNNFLLWITNWSYSTYILLHRWVARIFAIQAIVHSITLLLTYRGTGSYATDSKEPYWLWGIAATVLTCAMLILSALYFRRLSYEFFLILHILLAIFVIVGCWYHVVLRWGNNFYDNWLYAACAVWFFDRLVRVLRVAKNGIRGAIVTEIDPDHVRVDVPGLRWASKLGYIAFAYFPGLNPLRPWENHPFSINSTALFRRYQHALVPASPSLGHSPNEDRSAEKALQAVIVHDAAAAVGTAGVSLIIKKNAGLTRLLKSNNRLLTLLDGPYAQSHGSEILKCDHVLLLGCGIGIMGLIAWTRAHPNVKLAWGVKASAAALIKEMDAVLSDVVDKEVEVGARLDIEGLLRSEAEAGYRKVGVVVCGPGGMCDDVRARVAGLGRGGKTVFELEVDAFSW